MCESPQGSPDEVDHMEVFRKSGNVLVSTSPYGTISVTRPCLMSADFKTHRGLHFDLRMEDLQDAMVMRGQSAVVSEIGELVLHLIGAAEIEEAKP